MKTNLKKKILIISPDIPRPNSKGYQSLAYDRVIAYKENGYDVCIISHSLSFNKNDKKIIDKLENDNVKVFHSRVSKLSIFYNLLLGYFFSTVPFQTLIYKSNLFKKNLDNIIGWYKPNIIHIVTIRMTNEINTFKKPVIVDFVDSMFLNFSERLKSSNWFLSFFIKKELKRLKVYEKIIANLSKKSFVVSNKDLNIINSKKLFVLPLGLNLNFVKNINNICESHKIIFTGNMNYFPNIEAVEWFYVNCWNLIKKEIQNCKFYIVGRNPTSKILKLISNDNYVVATGEVESIYPHIKSSSLAIAPMQSGSGMQFKIIESMALKIPVITSDIGLGDIKALDGKNILIANNADIFVKKVVYLLKNKSQRNYIASEGQKYVFKNHNNIKINKTFIKNVKSI